MDSSRQRNVKGARAYQNTNLAERNALIQRYAHLVKRVAMHIKARLPPQVELDDLMQSGMIGLMDAVQNFKPENIASFEGYVMIRVRGSIIDHMRMYDWTPRNVHQNTRAMREVKTRLSQTLGRLPTIAEMAQEMGIDINVFQRMLQESHQAKQRSLSETNLTDETIAELPITDLMTGEVDEGEYAFKSIASTELRRDLAAAIRALPERESQIISLYYDKEMNLREIGLILQISESRTSQLLASAEAHLREIMSSAWDTAKGANSEDALPDCIGLAPARLAKTAERFTVEAAKQVKTNPLRTDLFADVEAQQAELEAKRAREAQRIVARKSAALAGVDYDNQRFFNSIEDERYKNTMTQAFNSDNEHDKSLLPEIDCKTTSDLPINTELRIPAFIHSSRPRFKFENLAAAREAAVNW